MSGLESPTMSSSGRSLIQLATKPGGPPNYATYAQIYRTNPWVYAAVNLVVYGLSRMELNVNKWDADGNFKQVRGDLPGSAGRPDVGQMLDNLLRNPEPGVGRHEWLRKIWLDRMVYGNALMVQDRGPSGSGLPSTLWHVPWVKVVVREGEFVPITAYEIQGSQGNKFIDPMNVIHMGRSGDLDNPVGLSALAPLRYTVALHDALQRHLNAYFNNAARPSGILKVQPGTNKDAQALIQEQVRKLYASPEQAGKIMVTSAEWQSLSDDPKNAAIIELAKLSREEIAAAFQTPPPLLGILDRAIKSNVQELRSQFIRDVIGPKADEFEQDFMGQLIGQNPAWRGYFVKFDLDSPLRPDLEARAVVYGQMRHVWTTNEMRKKEGMAPLDGKAGEYADTVWEPSGEIPLGLEQPQVAGADPAGTGTETPPTEPTKTAPKPTKPAAKPAV